MYKVQMIQSSPDEMYLVTAEELKMLQVQSQEFQQSLLIGRRWGISDCLKRLNGMRRDDFISHVLKPKRDELTEAGALLHWANGKGDRYRFGALKMAQWLEDNLQQITDGGWR